MTLLTSFQKNLPSLGPNDFCVWNSWETFRKYSFKDGIKDYFHVKKYYSPGDSFICIAHSDCRSKQSFRLFPQLSGPSWSCGEGVKIALRFGDSFPPVHIGYI